MPCLKPAFSNAWKSFRTAQVTDSGCGQVPCSYFLWSHTRWAVMNFFHQLKNADTCQSFVPCCAGILRRISAPVTSADKIKRVIAFLILLGANFKRSGHAYLVAGRILPVLTELVQLGSGTCQPTVRMQAQMGLRRTQSLETAKKRIIFDLLSYLRHYLFSFNTYDAKSPFSCSLEILHIVLRRPCVKRQTCFKR